MDTYSSPTVAIIYGWAEGPWQAKYFSRLLIEHNFRVIEDTSQANIIVAHSSGCYLVPANNSARLVVLIGLPYWPNKSLLKSGFTKLGAELSHHRKNMNLVWWLNKVVHNTWYILSRPGASFDVLTKHKDGSLPSASSHSVVVVRPSHDTFTHPEIAKLLTDRSYSFVELDGAHDDCWIYPQAYVELLMDEFDKTAV